jgi:glycosyltransferase involved in cell wall biosynthesis
VAGPKEIISDGVEGALVPPEKPEAIAAAAARILGDAETWRAMSRRARARAEEFSWDNVASRYEAVLARAIGRTKDGGR